MHQFDAQIASKNELGEQSYEVVLKYDSSQFSFKSGQYIWLVLRTLKYPDARGNRRAFSISSSPSEQNIIRLIFRDSDSGFKKTLLELNPGEFVDVIGPFGSSYIVSSEQQRYVLIAGGTGISPFLSLLRSCDSQFAKDIALIYLNFKDDRALFIEELSQLSAAKNFYYKSANGDCDDSMFPDNFAFLNADYYICGSQYLIDDAFHYLQSKGVTMQRMHFEQNYPSVAPNLTAKDFIDNSQQNLMLQAIHDSKNHVIVTDVNGKIIFANTTAEKNTGFTFSEMQGNTPRLWGGLMSPEFYKEFWHTKKSKSGFDGELINRRKNGEFYHVIAHISPIYDSAQRIIGYIGTEEDITVLRNTELKLSHITKRLRLATKAGKIGVWDWDLIRNILIWDDTMYQIYAISKSDFRGTYEAWRELVHHEDKDQFDKLINEATKEAKELNITFRVVWPDTSIHFIKANAIVEKDSAGKPVKIVGVNWDITSEMEIDKAKTEFISLASHQLRTPLSTIKWYLELLMSGASGMISSEQTKLIKEAYKGSERMGELVNALLNTTRIESNSYIIEPEPIKLDEFINKIIAELQPKITAKSLTINFESADIPEINLDRSLMDIIIHNLLTNAIKYSYEHTTIDIYTGKVAANTYYAAQKIALESVLIKVTDHGIGVPQDEQSKVFDKFYRADNAKRTESDGTGLGLYLTKSLIEKSKGMIWFESKENEGTTFYVTLPLVGMSIQNGTKKLN